MRRRKVGFVFQSINLHDALTAAENVEYALQLAGHRGRYKRERARQLLTLVEMGHRLHDLPKRLSGGERQRIAIARALANDGKIILADEPTASLDSISGGTIIDLLSKFHKAGQTIVMVTHEDEYAKYCDRIISMKDGKITKEKKR